MNAPAAPIDLLLSRLLALSRDETRPPCGCLRAVQGHAIKSAELSQPVLVLPLLGSKRLRDETPWQDVGPGQLMVVPGARRVDMEHRPDRLTGEYVAVGLFVPESVRAAARRLWDRPVPGLAGEVAVLALTAHPELTEGWRQWALAVEQGRALQADHALLGLVLRLCELGHAGLLAPVELRLAARIHAMVAERPARDWSSDDIERATGLSGATLRRRLADEGTSLRRVLVEARLACALQLLYTTRLPVKTVAQRVGYRSVSSFVRRFGERYGVEPSRIGLGAPLPEPLAA
ncbi:AraC family transcriptional regulator [Sphaerotilus sulfidivorans]|jgi:AraC-like DNA-binding protein|uniref:helix-turn-helix transcriptional regulator n=1 Tax=Sphaerotilus sulfidivorans TaxID=639200 RepID=UPI001B4AB9CB|nr:helix-turn-helix transcriptional regulator [Sphaerotilus sulfidivorans]MBP8175876.1 helix-turn-helix transcriptional regulator [Sphaerotilus sp.]MCK6402402.1 helix-turn-helix transcriptional regulator [Sphaerotilus sulfidivorans]